MKNNSLFPRTLITFPVLAMAVLVAGQAHAAVITVPNFSFENPDTGGYTETIDNWLRAGPGGTFTAVIENGTQGAAIAGITGSQFGDIDGNRVGARLYQDLAGSTYTVGESYTLTVDVATRQNSLVSAGATLRLQLRDSSDNLAAFTDILGSTVLAAGANFTTFSVTLPAVQITDVWANQTIRIRLEDTVATGQGAD